MWFNFAASRATGSCREIGVIRRDEAAARMTPEQIVEAERVACGR
jgi:hypothetical protein